MLAFFRNLVTGSSAYAPATEEEFFLETRLPVWLETPRDPIDQDEYQRQLASWDAQHRASLERSLGRQG